MDTISKIFIHGTIRKKGLCMENAGDSEDEILDAIYDVLETKGYELEVTANYVENSFNIENRQKRGQRLIDANNIDWNGFSFTAAFAESMEVVLSHQKEITLNDSPNNSRLAPLKVSEIPPIRQGRTHEYVNPCDACRPMSFLGVMGCLNECPYGDE